MNFATCDLLVLVVGLQVVHKQKYLIYSYTYIYCLYCLLFLEKERKREISDLGSLLKENLQADSPLTPHDCDFRNGLLPIATQLQQQEPRNARV